MNEIEKIKRKILPVLKKHNVLKAGLFGSFVRGEARKKSDVDILVKLPKGKSLLDLVGLEMELKKRLRRNVDLLTYNSIHPLIKEAILKEEVRIYENGE
jgi:predicted nucleotidyltransferase